MSSCTWKRSRSRRESRSRAADSSSSSLFSKREPHAVRGFDLAREALQSPIGIEQLALFGGPHQRLEFVLPVDVEHRADDLAQQLHRNLLAVEPGARAAVAVEDAPHDELVARLVDGLLLQAVAQAARRGPQVERRHHLRAFGIAANQVGAAAAAGGERQRIDDDRLAGARLAREHREAGREIDVERVDDGEIADAEVREHQRSCPAARSSLRS